MDKCHRIADIGCGGGGPTLAIANAAPVGSEIIGFDISRSLIEHAKTLASPNENPLSFQIADLQSEPTAKPFSRIASRFGVMFFERPAIAFANIANMLSPGGRFAFAVWAPLANNAWMLEVKDTVAMFADIPTPQSDSAGPFRYANPEILISLLGNAGLNDLSVDVWDGKLPVGGGLAPKDAASFALKAFSIAKLIADKPPEVFDKALENLSSRYAEHVNDGVVKMQAEVLIVTGARPSV